MRPQKGPPRRAPAAAPAPARIAELELRRRLQAEPGNASLWQQLALLCAETDRAPEAVEAFARAIAAGASATALALPHASALSAAGRAEEAVAVAAAAHARRPKEFAFANLLGVMLKRAGRLEEAIRALETARRLDPRAAAAWQNLGNVHDQMGRFREAAAAYAAGAKLEPRNGYLVCLQGRALRAGGEVEAAIAAFERSIAITPGLLGGWTDLIGTLIEASQVEKGLAALERLEALTPGNLDVQILRARVYLRLGRREEALAIAARAEEQRPGDAILCMLIARIHGDADLRAGNAALRKGVAANPRHGQLQSLLIESLARSRYDDEAAHLQEAYERACAMLRTMPGEARRHAKPLRTVFMRCLDLDRLEQTGALPDLAPRWMGDGDIAALHYELGHVETLEDRLRIVEWHRQWGQREARLIAPVARPAMPAIQTGRKLRIGFMSSDLRDHPVSYFALPLLERYDRDRVEVYCYSFYERARDQVQAHIEGQVTGFRWWPRRPVGEIAEGIARDGLDILFELGGTTAMNKLSVMAYRPARIGASWLGYPHSAGLEQIDTILVDPYIKPSEPGLLIEQPFEMPETWVTLGNLGFRPVPIEESLPEERRGALTFGTMNNPYKFTRACLDAWAAVLRAVPGSRFLFVRPEARSAAFVANARAAFAARDVDPDRLDYVGVRGAHLPHYNAIDIALDSLPHVGGTTTCETLWMGVPCVSLVGPGFPERLSYSNLSNAGLGDLAVFSLEDYVSTAVALAGDRARRRLLRHGLRDMIRRNPLGQADRFVQGFYDRALEVARR
ncbi:tetratricopeptide repeat protein [Paracraurococcus lichenis]|uniref:protein O-GlcNAc transferase n=1 Tax=Paracraurococcus lichenis TaxID=3064888 RepID=A0ABT9DSW2_9PROT|nr:glycosyltransferase family 41 protein [Paracraurococcus sp. LOR1-02]MDO9706979.1 tetratricopeptide repeat protein [Paracraurococcus sp. LOR1-02]